MKHLRLAKDLSLPLDAVTQTFLIVGKRGSGKSNTAARFVEQLHHARLPFVVLDPVDTWWGLKASRDGGKGLDVYVFGGKHADLPLEAGGGALIADVLCEHRMPMVLSVKHLSGRERSTFMVAFAQTLFQKWGGGPLHVVLEEAHELAPQLSGGRGKDTDGESAMLGAFKRLWKLGRASGIGGTAVTQRPASLSKDITTQSEILIAHRTIGPQDVKAVGEWVKYHGERLDILAELPTLPTGEAFVWAPEFPEGKAIGLQRSSILLRETYDSASTPKVGEQRIEPKELAAVDLDRLRTKMAATIEKAKQDDPRELRKEIARLKGEITKVPAAAVVTPKTVEKAILTDADRALLEKVAEAGRLLSVNVPFDVDDAWGQALATLVRFKADIVNELSDRRAEFEHRLASKGFQKILDKLSAVKTPANYSQTIPTVRKPLIPQEPASPGGSRSTARPAGGEGTLGKGERIVLMAAAQHQAGVTREQLTVLTGYARSTRDTYLQRLGAAGYVTTSGSFIVATDAGVAALGDFEPLPTGDALRAHWLRELPEGERRILEILSRAYPDAVERTAIDEATGYARSSRDTYLQRLGARRLITVERGSARASEELFS